MGWTREKCKLEFKPVFSILNQCGSPGTKSPVSRSVLKLGGKAVKKL